jgi:hypothetical protein
MSAAVLVLCLLSAKARSLDQAAKALADFRADEAITLLERAKEEGPYSRKDLILLYEELGVANAYLDKQDAALGAFDVLLALDPGHAISYTLSPKVTFIFEQARGKASDRPPPNLDLGWPLGLRGEDAIPIDIEVLADSKGILRKAKLYTRLKGTPAYASTDVTLPPVGQHVQVDLPPQAPSATVSEVVDVYLVAFDAKGNEVYQWGEEKRPREIPLRYEAPEPWYTHWWIWAIAGGVVAAGASAGVFAATHSLPPTVNGTLRVQQ